MTLMPGLRLFAGSDDGERFLADGAMGTELMKRGVTAHRILAANLEHPEWVREMHAAYLQAGAQVITANTFGIPVGDEFEDAVRAGIEIAESAATESEREIWVWASFAPQTVIEQRSALARLGSVLPKILLVETCVSLLEAIQAIIVLRELKGHIKAVTCHFRADGTLPDGTTAPDTFETLCMYGASIRGANCGASASAFPSLAKQWPKFMPGLRLFQPSAGIPAQNERGEWVYPVEPEQWAEIGMQLFDAGVNIVGGCCGTTPAHIAALAERVSGC